MTSKGLKFTIMTRITKTIAKKLASELLREKTCKLEEKEITMKTYATELVLDSIPDPILKAFYHDKSYFKLTNRFSFTAPGPTQIITVTLSGVLPYSENLIHIDLASWDNLGEQIERIDDLRREIDSLFVDLTELFVQLGTKSKAVSEFPHLEEFIPDPKPKKKLSPKSIKNRLK